MRTDSPRLDPEALEEIRTWIGSSYPGYLADSPRSYGSKDKGGVKTQDAHEAIRPTSVELTPESVRPYLTEEQYRLYELIWRRTVASQMSDARYAVTTISVEAADGILEAKGRVTLFDGFHRTYSGLKKGE